MTEKQKTGLGQPARIDMGTVESLIEDIRLAALNIAITASKLSIEGDSRIVIRRKIGELVSLSLDTVNQLAQVMKKVNGESQQTDLDPEEHYAEVKQIEVTINRKVAEIAQLLAAAGLDERY